MVLARFDSNRGEWKDKIVTSKEIVTLVKTKKENWAKVKKAVEAIHPYETPCIMKFDVESNASYAQWIEDETKYYELARTY